jgi:transglutaminase/protease-like cytokinesis protein 3
MIIKNITVIFLFVFSTFSAQEINPVDKKVLDYPKSFSSIDKLAEKIQSDFTTDYDKARAVYVWVANSINYDMKLAQNPTTVAIKYESKEQFDQKVEELKQKRINQAFRSRKGVCQHFTELYHEIAERVGLKVQSISGFGRVSPNQIGVSSKPLNHTWNAVFADNRWILLDATWGSGYAESNTSKFSKRYSDFYFDTPEQLFFMKHFPEDGKWLDKTLNRDWFENLPLHYFPFPEKGIVLLDNKGVLQAVDGQKLTFKLKNLTQTENILFEGKPNQRIPFTHKILEDNVVESEIIYKKQFGRYITIYLENVTFATFKVLPNKK